MLETCKHCIFNKKFPKTWSDEDVMKHVNFKISYLMFAKTLCILTSEDKGNR